LVPLAKKFASEEPSIEIVGGENVISWPFVVKHIDCYTFTVEEFKSITTTYKVSSMMLAPIHGFGLWFEVEFNGPAESCSNLSSDSSPLDIIQKKRRRASDSTVVLSTAPEDEPTHWHQVLIKMAISNTSLFIYLVILAPFAKFALLVFCRQFCTSLIL
uniref:Protein arginine N-methyltransferase domain-containing protein n=1 Tax=Aegilops tauschii subsp. strangulata TaxID=200361 RepID=A0A453DFW3_AEGTS